MSALDAVDDLAAWLDARSELVDEWLACCELTEPAVEAMTSAAVAVVRPTGAPRVAAFAGSLFGAEGGQSSGGGSSGRPVLAA